MCAAVERSLVDTKCNTWFIILKISYYYAVLLCVTECIVSSTHKSGSWLSQQVAPHPIPTASHCMMYCMHMRQEVLLLQQQPRVPCWPDEKSLEMSRIYQHHLWLCAHIQTARDLGTISVKFMKTVVDCVPSNLCVQMICKLYYEEGTVTRVLHLYFSEQKKQL
jgi:hypothetical protein